MILFRRLLFRRKKSPQQQEQGRGIRDTCGLFVSLVVLGAALVLVITFAALLLKAVNIVGHPLDSFLSVFGFEKHSTPVVVDSRTIVLGIQKLALLQTVSSDILIEKKVVDASTAPDSELRISYIGYVTAGIDLSQITETSVVVNPDNSLTIILPPSQITGCYLKNPQIENSSCTDILFGIQDCDKILKRLQETAYNRAIEELLQTAYELKIPDLAYQNAQTAVYDLLHTLGYDRIEFQQQPGELPPSESCIVP